MRHDERREFKRFQIMGGKVRYWPAAGPESVGNLIDLSKTSARFQINGNLANGDLLGLEIFFPSQERIKLNGRVVWTSIARDTLPAYAAVQFVPFPTEEFRTTPAFRQLDMILNTLEM